MIKFPKINLNKKKVIYSFIILFLILGTFPFIFYSILNHNYQSKIFDKTNDVPETYAALVLGAGVYKNGEPSPILQDRLNAAVDLYNSGKVTKLIVSGDNRFTHYDEPTVMKDFLVNKGIPEEAIQPDFAGRRTYDSCWRAKNIFSQDKIVIVTQSFHMTRSIFTCQKLGIESYGFIADKDWHSNSNWSYWSFRDILATSKGLIDLYIKSPYVVGGEKIDI